MRHRLCSKFAMLALGGLLCNAPAAAALSYVESADLTSTTVPLGSLGQGVNTISGSISGSCGTFQMGSCSVSGDGADAFSFLIPNNLKIVSATATITNYFQTGNTQSGGQSSSDLVDFLFNANVAAFDVLPALDITGTQNFRFFSSYGSGAASSQFSWLLTLIAEDRANGVSLPGTLSLALAALGLLGVCGSRKSGVRGV